MTPHHHDHPDLPRTEPEFRAQRLGFALSGLAAELVAERQKVLQLRREVALLNARSNPDEQGTAKTAPTRPAATPEPPPPPAARAERAGQHRPRGRHRRS